MEKSTFQLLGADVLLVSDDSSRVPEGTRLQLIEYKEGTMYKALVMDGNNKGSHILVDLNHVTFTSGVFSRLEPVVIPFKYTDGWLNQSEPVLRMTIIKDDKNNVSIKLSPELARFNVQPDNYVSLIQPELLDVASFIGLQFSSSKPAIPCGKIARSFTVTANPEFVNSILQLTYAPNNWRKIELIFTSRVFRNLYTHALVFTVQPQIEILGNTGDKKEAPVRPRRFPPINQ